MPEKFSVGDEVVWRSQAGGSWKTKHGVVARVVPAGERGIAGSPTRDHESFVVRVGTQDYWPRVSALVWDGGNQFAADARLCADALLALAGYSNVRPELIAAARRILTWKERKDV